MSNIADSSEFEAAKSLIGQHHAAVLAIAAALMIAALSTPSSPSRRNRTRWANRAEVIDRAADFAVGLQSQLRSTKYCKSPDPAPRASLGAFLFAISRRDGRDKRSKTHHSISLARHVVLRA
jgi:hypothetical protein